MSRVVCYTRVSTDMQEREGASLDAQIATCVDYAQRHQLKIVGEIRDVVSGTKESLDRPKLRQALAMLEDREADGLLVWSLDRLSRNTLDALSLAKDYFAEKSPFQLHAATDPLDFSTPMGKFFITLRLSMAEYEAARIRERIKSVKDFYAKRGYYQGGEVPYGCQAIRHEGRYHLVPDPAELRVVRKIAELRRKKVSLRGISERLAKDGDLNRQGKPFHPQQVKRVCELVSGPSWRTISRRREVV